MPYDVKQVCNRVKQYFDYDNANTLCICIIILMHPAKMFLTYDLIKVFF